MSKKLFFALAFLGCLLMLVPGAFGDTVSIGLQLGSGSIVNASSIGGIYGAGPGAATFVGSYGSFTLVTTVGTGSGDDHKGEPTFISTASNFSTTAPGDLTIYVTEQSVLPAAAANGFTSTFSTNALLAGWTVEESTYIDPNNGQFTTSTTPGMIQLGTHTFSDPLSKDVAQNHLPITLNDPFSETEVFHIHANSAGGGTGSAIHITPAPELSSIALFGSGLLGFAGFARRRFLK